MKRSDWLSNNLKAPRPELKDGPEYLKSLLDRDKISPGRQRYLDSRARAQRERVSENLPNANRDMGYGPQHRKRLREAAEERQRRSTLEERLRTGDLTAEEWRERYTENMLRNDGPFDANNDNTTRLTTSNSTRNSVRHARNSAFF